MYTPPQKIIDNYAKVMVRFALNGGTGLKKGQTVLLVGTEVTKPLFMACRREIYKAGGNVVMHYLPDNTSRSGADFDFYANASSAQISHFPAKLHEGLLSDIDCSIYLYAETDMHTLEHADPKKIIARSAAFNPWFKAYFAKTDAGKFFWTLCLYGTPAMAKEAGLSEKQYWQQIIDACFLNEIDPIKKWKETFKAIAKYEQKLNRLTPKISKLHVEGLDADLWIGMGEKRKWMSGNGYNIPSFEIFTSPDCRKTEGWIRFNQPLFYQSNRIEGIELWFKDGRVIRFKATKNEKLLKEMIKAKNANMIGEYSLTDRRLSRITKFMAETLYDENIGGKYGNTHLALGEAYKECYDGDRTNVSETEWKQLGFNDSPIHTDIMSTAPRTVTAHMKDGTTRVIYQDGEFIL